jgi:hypothetical protein
LSSLDFAVLVAVDAPILLLFLCVLCVLARECSSFRAPTALRMRSGRECGTKLNQWFIVWVHGEEPKRLRQSRLPLRTREHWIAAARADQVRDFEHNPCGAGLAMTMEFRFAPGTAANEPLLRKT